MITFIVAYAIKTIAKRLRASMIYIFANTCALVAIERLTRHDSNVFCKYHGGGIGFIIKKRDLET